MSCPTDTNPRHGSASEAPSGAVPILTPIPQPGDALLNGGSERPSMVRIEIPADIQQVIARAPAEAETWRWAVRDHFEWALGNGYAVTGLHRDPVTSRSFYTLELEAAAP